MSIKSKTHQDKRPQEPDFSYGSISYLGFFNLKQVFIMPQISKTKERKKERKGGGRKRKRTFSFKQKLQKMLHKTRHPGKSLQVKRKGKNVIPILPKSQPHYTSSVLVMNLNIKIVVLNEHCNLHIMPQPTTISM